MVPWEQYKYAIYADARGWTPGQVDDLTLDQDMWLFPIWEALARARGREQARRDKEAEAAADRRRRKGMM